MGLITVRKFDNWNTIEKSKVIFNFYDLCRPVILPLSTSSNYYGNSINEEDKANRSHHKMEKKVNNAKAVNVAVQ